MVSGPPYQGVDQKNTYLLVGRCGYNIGFTCKLVTFMFVVNHYIAMQNVPVVLLCIYIYMRKSQYAMPLA